jgi:hypothetical protein
LPGVFFFFLKEREESEKKKREEEKKEGSLRFFSNSQLFPAAIRVRGVSRHAAVSKPAAPLCPAHSDIFPGPAPRGALARRRPGLSLGARRQGKGEKRGAGEGRLKERAFQDGLPLFNLVGGIACPSLSNLLPPLSFDLFLRLFLFRFLFGLLRASTEAPGLQEQRPGGARGQERGEGANKKTRWRWRSKKASRRREPKLFK